MSTRRERMEKERDWLRVRLEEECGLVSHPKARRLFELAWEYGHASGIEEVAGYYRAMAELLDD